MAMAEGERIYSQPFALRVEFGLSSVDLSPKRRHSASAGDGLWRCLPHILQQDVDLTVFCAEISTVVDNSRDACHGFIVIGTKSTKCQPLHLPFSWPTFLVAKHTFSPNGMYRFSPPRARRHAVGCSLSCAHFHSALPFSCNGRMSATWIRQPNMPPRNPIERIDEPACGIRFVA